jgi:hypothetical protein
MERLSLARRSIQRSQKDHHIVEHHVVGVEGDALGPFKEDRVAEVSVGSSAGLVINCTSGVMRKLVRRLLLDARETVEST